MQAVLGRPAWPGPAFACASKSQRPARRLVARAAHRQDNEQPEGAGSQKPAAWKGALLGAALAPLVVSPRWPTCAVHRPHFTMNTHAGRSRAAGLLLARPARAALPAAGSLALFKCHPCAPLAGHEPSPGRGCCATGAAAASRRASLSRQRAPAPARASNSNRRPGSRSVGAGGNAAPPVQKPGAAAPEAAADAGDAAGAAQHVHGDRGQRRSGRWRCRGHASIPGCRDAEGGCLCSSWTHRQLPPGMHIFCSWRPLLASVHAGNSGPEALLTASCAGSP